MNENWPIGPPCVLRAEYNGDFPPMGPMCASILFWARLAKGTQDSPDACGTQPWLHYTPVLTACNLKSGMCLEHLPI